MLGFVILLGFHLLGLLLKFLLHIPLPANVIGLILFIASLFCGWVKLNWVENSAQFLLEHLMLFFVPYIVGTIVFWPLIRSEAAAIITGMVISTLVVMLVTGWTTKWLGSRRDEGEGQRR
jgi:holin-like protein